MYKKIMLIKVQSQLTSESYFILLFLLLIFFFSPHAVITFKVEI